MGRDFDSRFPRFHIGAQDRVVIAGEAFRLLQQTDQAYVLLPAEGAGMAQTFSFEHLNKLNRDGKIRHEVDWFVPAGLRPQPARPVGAWPMALLSPQQKLRLDIRHAYVQAFKELAVRGDVCRTEASIERGMDRIRDLALPYLEATADLAAIDKAAAARKGRGRRPMGGTLSVTVAKVHPRTLLGWVRAEEKGGKAGLTDGFAKRGNRMSPFTHEENALLMAEVRKSYLSLNRPPMTTTITDVRDAFRMQNLARAKGQKLLKVPGRQAIRACIGALDRFHVLVARHGAEEAIKRSRPVGRGLDVARPLERVETDEWRIDLMTIMARAGLRAVFTEDELESLGLTDEKARWWIAMSIDCRTKIILGMTLTKDPKASAAAHCLRMVVSDKGGFSDATGAATRWDQYGAPELLVADNGPAFKSVRFTDACNDLGVTLERTIAGAPSMRGTVERLFQTCATGLLPRLSGRTFSDVVERAGHPAEARACLGPEDLCFALVRWIVDVYHNTPHSGLGGRTPLRQWEADHAAGNYPLRAAPDARSRRLAFGTSLSRTATRAGVTVMGVRYHSEALARSYVENGPRAIDLRWDAEDIGEVEALIDGEWRAVPAVHDGFDGLHAQVWIAARRALRTTSPNQRQWEEDVVRRAIAAIGAMNAQRSLQFGLIDHGWDEVRVKQLEESLFTGFHVTATASKTRACVDGHGVSVVPRAPEDEAACAPDASAAQVLAPRPPRSERAWTCDDEEI